MYMSAESPKQTNHNQFYSYKPKLKTIHLSAGEWINNWWYHCIQKDIMSIKGNDQHNCKLESENFVMQNEMGQKKSILYNVILFEFWKRKPSDYGRIRK